MKAAIDTIPDSPCLCPSGCPSFRARARARVHASRVRAVCVPLQAIVGLRAFAGLKEEPACVRTRSSARARADAFAGQEKEPACARVL